MTRPTRRHGFLLATLAAVMVARVSAQIAVHPALTLGAAGSLPGTSSPMVVAPAVAWQIGRVTGHLSTAANMTPGAGWIRDLDGVMTLELGRFGRVDWSASAATAQRQPSAAGPRWTTSRAEVRASRSWGPAVVTVGTGILRSGNAATTLRAPVLRLAATLDRAQVRITANAHFSMYRGTTRLLDSTDFNRALGDTLVDGRQRPTLSSTNTRFTTQASLALSTVWEGVNIDATVGAFVVAQRATRPFGSLLLTHWFTPNAALVTGFSREVLDPVGGLSTFRTILGVKLGWRTPGSVTTARSPIVAPPPLLAAVSPLGLVRVGDSVVVTLTASAAHSVALRGDLTGWSAVAFRRQPGGRWRVALGAAPGVYRVHLRIDGGAWQPPPGMAQVVDVYEGMVGMLVVP